MSANDHFCTMPKSVLRQMGGILFMGLRGTVIPRSYDGGRLRDRWDRPPESVRATWTFLRTHPYVFVVLVPDQKYQASTIRDRLLPISLENRIIGATAYSSTDLRAACDHWMASYASGNAFAILDDRREAFPNSEDSFISPSSEQGVRALDLEQVLEVLQRSHRIVHDPSLTSEDQFLLAVNLFFCGQTDLCNQLLAELSKKLGRTEISSRPYIRRGERSGYLLFGEPMPDKFHEIANMLGIRVSINLEPSTNRQFRHSVSL